MAGGKQSARGARRAPSTRGDFTGNKDAQLRQEHEEVLDARRSEIGLQHAKASAIREEGVVDLMGAQPTVDFDNPDLASALQAQLSETAQGMQGAPVDTRGRDVMVSDATQTPPEGVRMDGGGKSTFDVFELPEERPQASMQAGEVMTPDMMMEPTVIRALYDLEDVTIGYGNTHTFREGMRYKVPRWVAAHFEEKGLCLVLSLNPA